jgi:hypothetical protein
VTLVGTRRALLSRRPVTAGGLPPGTYATWNPADKHATVSLSGGNLTATGGTASDTNGAVRSTVGKSSGKWYWEVTVVTVGTNFQAHGIGSGTQNLDAGNAYANLEGLRVYFSFNGNKYLPATAYGASFTAGDVLGFALDMDAGTLVAYKNNVSQGTLVSGLTGTIYAYSIPASANGGTAAVCTANFGATALAFSPPAGFSAGLFA